MAPDHRQKSAGCATHPSAVDLFTRVLSIFTARGFSQREALPVAYFAIATWFSGCLPEAPCLLITGPGPEARLLLELLECVVFRPQPLCELTRAGFLALDLNSEPTLLIVQEDISPSVGKLIRASNCPNAQVSGASSIKKIYCAKVLYFGTNSTQADANRSLLRAELSPLCGRPPILEANQKKQLIAEFQPKMQAYRERNFLKVRDSRFDLPDLSSEIRMLARVLGAPIVSAPELQAALGTLLREYQEAIRESFWSDPKCVVIESALFYSHKAQMERVRVKEITVAANALLKGRGESLQLEAKAVGAILRRLGLLPKRDAKGFAVRLENGARRHIHRLASRFAVATVQQNVMSCEYCAAFFAFGPDTEGHMAPME